MTVKQCQAKAGPHTNERMCEAFIKAGLTLKDVTPDYALENRGRSAKEVAALVEHYISSPPPMGECEPGCELCKSDSRSRKHR